MGVASIEAEEAVASSLFDIIIYTIYVLLYNTYSGRSTNAVNSYVLRAAIVERSSVNAH